MISVNMKSTPMRPEDLLPILRAQRGEVAVVGEFDPPGDVEDVAAAVAVLRRGLAGVRGDEAAREAVDLRAVVVEVVLAGDRRALRLQDAGERIADGSPPGAAEVDRTGRVRRDELEVDDLVGARVVRPEGGAGVDDRLGERAGGRGIQPDVDEAGSGDLDARDTGRRAEGGGDLGGELARVRADHLGELHRGVGRPVAVVAVLRTLEREVGCREPLRGAGSARLGERGDDGDEGGGEGFGIHSLSSLRARPRRSPWFPCAARRTSIRRAGPAW